MNFPDNAYSAPISDYQFRLLALLCHLAGPEGVVKARIADLCSRTNKTSEKTVRRALKALEGADLICRVPTKRANGLRGVDTYKLTFKGTQMSTREGDSNVHASHDYRSRNKPTSKPLVPNSKSSYQLKDLGNKENKNLKEIKVPMRKWEDDGDDLAGFGLVEPKDAPQSKIRKSDPKTRAKRPEHEWTPMDVAAEFSFRVGRKYPLLPGTVNVRSLSGALSKFRKQYGTTALIELELLKMFMEDERNFKDIGDEAPHLYKKYLASFGTKMNQARETLGLKKVTAKVQVGDMARVLTASDGKVFQNSLSGRAQLERYEKKLMQEKN